jgi:hypothetical protein
MSLPKCVLYLTLKLTFIRSLFVDKEKTLSEEPIKDVKKSVKEAIEQYNQFIFR